MTADTKAGLATPLNGTFPRARPRRRAPGRKHSLLRPQPPSKGRWLGRRRAGAAACRLGLVEASSASGACVNPAGQATPVGRAPA